MRRCAVPGSDWLSALHFQAPLPFIAEPIHHHVITDMQLTRRPAPGVGTLSIPRPAC